jgi:hypothetical protein
MVTHTRQAALSHSAAVTQWELNIGTKNKDVDHTSVVMPAAVVSPGRRCERMDYRQMSSYEGPEVIDGDSVVIGQGEAFALNRSMEGMLLLIALAPYSKQLIEAHTSPSGWGRIVNLFETRWARPVPVEAQGNLYLVGCRRIFGPCHSQLF